MEVNQPKIFRVLQLILQLKRKPAKSVKFLSGLLETTDRTVYRYLELLEELGYPLRRDSFNRYYIEESGHPLELTFSSDEASYLHDVLSQVKSDGPLHRRTMAKVAIMLAPPLEE